MKLIISTHFFFLSKIVKAFLLIKCHAKGFARERGNNCKHISVYEGDASLLKGKKYDVIIANINRNILLNDMQQYVNCLNENGILFLSGFYTEDIPVISESCTAKGLTYVKQFERNNWVALKFIN